MMTQAKPVSAQLSNIPTPFLTFADHGMYLAHQAGGQHAVIQVLWRFRRPVDLDALTRFYGHLAHGRLARLIRPAQLPFGRHQWSSAPRPSPVLAVAADPISPVALQSWADAQVELPLDPTLGPAWNFTVQPLTDGSTVASLVVSHCIADGMAATLAIGEAVRGERWPSVDVAGNLSKEILRILKDMPTTFRALAELIRTVWAARSQTRLTKASPATITANDQTVAFPSVFIRVPISDWDARAASLGANRLALLAAVTAAFAEALGRVRDGHVTLLFPVNQRDGLSDSGGNRVSLATFKVPVDEPRGRLHQLQRRLQAALLKTRREPDSLAKLMPLVPFVPRRAFSTAGRLALGALADLPVTCSHSGDLPADVLMIDGIAADRICFRGIDRKLPRHAIEERQGVATLHSGLIPGFLLLNFVAYQPGVVTEPRHLRAIVERLLAAYDLAGESFDG